MVLIILKLEKEREEVEKKKGKDGKKKDGRYYWLCELNQEDNRRLNIKKCKDEKDAVDKFRELIIKYGNCDSENFKTRKWFKWLWERRGHSQFVWIVESTNPDNVDLILDREFLDDFPSEK